MASQGSSKPEYNISIFQDDSDDDDDNVVPETPPRATGKSKETVTFFEVGLNGPPNEGGLFVPSAPKKPKMESNVFNKEVCMLADQSFARNGWMALI